LRAIKLAGIAAVARPVPRRGPGCQLGSLRRTVRVPVRAPSALTHQDTLRAASAAAAPRRGA
jgi:hypothetical protein